MEGFTKVRPSWKKIKVLKAKKVSHQPPKVCFSSKLDIGVSIDRLSFNKAATKLMGLTETVKCELLLHKKDRKLAISILPDCSTEDSFTLSYSKENSCIRRKELFSMLDLPKGCIKYLQKEPYTSEVTHEGSLFIMTLPEEVPYGIIIDPATVLNKKKSRSTAMPHSITDDLKEALKDL